MDQHSKNQHYPPGPPPAYSELPLSFPSDNGKYLILINCLSDFTQSGSLLCLNNNDELVDIV